MNQKIPDMYSISELYIAYRKAKAEAFYENTHFHALAFTKYEQTLDKNLRSLQQRLLDRHGWEVDSDFLGDFAYLPKSIDTTAWENQQDGHFRALDPSQDWQRRFEESKKPAQASLRLVIRASVDFQVISALWILSVGHRFDATLDQSTSFGNRLRRAWEAPSEGQPRSSTVNRSTPGLFAPYFSAYRSWREGGLSAMEHALSRKKSILAITMDIERFYHRVSPKFLLRPSFLKQVGVTLSTQEREFTRRLLAAISTWYKTTPDSRERPAGAIPVGLSASKIIANVLLAEFDTAIVKNLKPIYYGRYVDDIFLVLAAKSSDLGANGVTKKIADALSPMVQLKETEGKPASLRLRLPYARDSELIFAGPKQKIFALSSEHGSDLVHHIRDQIRQQSSEYRLLPALPDTGIAMAARALLATPNAALQADALRKADVVSVRRLGLSLLLSDVETYAADLRPESWEPIRREFYDLAFRHLITPTGFFEFFSHIPRVFGLMLGCGDIKEAKELIERLRTVAEQLLATSNLGQTPNAYNLCLQQYARALIQAGIQAATVRSVNIGPGYLSTIRKLRKLDPNLRPPSTIQSLERLSREVLLADWGRRPYKDYWFQDQPHDENGPSIPRELKVRRQLRLGAIRRFRLSTTDLKAPHWPALVFPTRPLRIDEIGLISPSVLSDNSLFRIIIRSLRGAEVASSERVGFSSKKDGANNGTDDFLAPGKPRRKVRIAVTSVGTTVGQWAAAAKGESDRSARRYANINRLLNQILKEEVRPDYIVLPELSIPLRWALRAARKLATNGVSLLAGVEYYRDRRTRKLRNDCLISLTTDWPGYLSSISVRLPKFSPAHGERIELQKLLRRKNQLFTPPTTEKIAIFEHCGFSFSALICSDLTNIAHRNRLRGKIDALFALEWNQDTKTFASLVESAASDLHAFVIQANNRAYGDSRIRAPATEDFARDVVQVKGGITDYYVIGEVDHVQLRSEQNRRPSKPRFKPTPIGFSVSERRKPK